MENTIVFIDKNGNRSEMHVSDYCKITLNIQDGKVVNTKREESVRMKPKNIIK